MENDNSENEIESIRELPEINYNKISIITFAKFNRYFFIIFLCPIFCMLTNFFLLLIDETKMVQNRGFFISNYILLTYFMAGLFHFISYFKVKLNKNKELSYNNKNNNSGIIYIYTENEDKINNYNPCKIILFIILLSLIIVIIYFLNNFIYKENVFEVRIFYLFFIPLFSKIILKENIYKHQYFSLIIATSGLIFLLIPVILKLSPKDILPNIFNFIRGILYSLFLVIFKYIIEKYYISPLKICLLFGIIALFINCFGYIIYSLIKYNNLNIFKDCLDFSQVENKFISILYIILLFLFGITLQLFTFLALFYFSPTLLMVTEVISPTLYWIAVTIKKGELKMPDIVLNPIGYAIVLFSALIYNEIIIFNFCSLNKNTKKFVNQRINLELEDIKNTPLTDN